MTSFLIRHDGPFTGLNYRNYRSDKKNQRTVTWSGWGGNLPHRESADGAGEQSFRLAYANTAPLITVEDSIP